MRDPREVARDLLGQRLIRSGRGGQLSGLITETEAYLGAADSASHAYRGKTPRNAVMFGPAGHAYVYFVYGMHHMLNVVTGEESMPWAVLIRALFPVSGLTVMRRRRGRNDKLCDGPGKLCQALDIDRALNGHDFTSGRRLWIAAGAGIPDTYVRAAPRIGIDYASPEHRAALWRFTVAPGWQPGFGT